MKSYLKKIKEHDPLSADERMKLIESSSKLVGPEFLFNTYCNCFFLPVFSTDDGRKIIQSISVDKIIYTDSRCVFSYYTDPSLISYLLKGKLRPENKNPINRKWKVGIRQFFFV
jgi:Cu(I)/Ag(I) efflux system membrane protein CusA/SilA